jgi:hypothetical protein
MKPLLICCLWLIAAQSWAQSPQPPAKEPAEIWAEVWLIRLALDEPHLHVATHAAEQQAQRLEAEQAQAKARLHRANAYWALASMLGLACFGLFAHLVKQKTRRAEVRLLAQKRENQALRRDLEDMAEHTQLLRKRYGNMLCRLSFYAGHYYFKGLLARLLGICQVIKINNALLEEEDTLDTFCNDITEFDRRAKDFYLFIDENGQAQVCGFIHSDFVTLEH